ncbi:MAG TPA: tetratricopeptide repeat protein, partial [Flavobacteriales bacterium]|nr:tetratricopeptide repeat protein [Flavobacteriales bacterium]
MKIFRKSFSIILLFSFFASHTQILPKQKDSIINILKMVQSIEKLKSIDILVDYYIKNNPDSALIYNTELLKEIQKTSNQKYLAKYYNNLAVYYLYQSQFYKAKSAIEHAIIIQQKEDLKNDLADSYKTLAGIYYYLESYNEAITFSFKTLKIYEGNNNNLGVISSLNNIGLLNAELGNFNKAVENYRSAINLINMQKIIKNKASLYGNLGMVYKKKKEYDSAKLYYNKSIKEDLKYNSKRGLTHTYYDLANLYAFYLKNLDSANYYYKKSLKWAIQNDKTMLASIYSAKARMLIESGNYSNGIITMKKALKIAENNGSKQIIKLAHYKLYEVYKKQNKWKEAILHLESYIDMSEAMETEKGKLAMANMEAKYENEKNRAKIETLMLRQKMDKKIKRLLIFAILLMSITFMLFTRNFFIKRKKNLVEKELLKIEKEKIDQELQFKTRQLTSQALMMMQKNKLIDTILQNLSKIKGDAVTNNKELANLKRKLKKSLHS